MTSTENVMSVVFVSDHSVASEGFTASYTTVNATTGLPRHPLTVATLRAGFKGAQTGQLPRASTTRGASTKQ